jgi:hypothetical protein
MINRFYHVKLKRTGHREVVKKGLFSNERKLI